jgi:hypothetical protein
MPDTLPPIARADALDATEATILADIGLDTPWNLIETFAQTPRWRPEDVNRAAGIIAARLQALGVPVTVHRPPLFLSIPHHASVEAGRQTFSAKPPSAARSVPGGLTGEVVYLPANRAALRSYAKSVTELFGRPESDLAALTARIRGRIVLTEGFGNPALTQIVEEWGGIGLIAINPGEDIHWGTCTTVWGNPDLDDLPRKPGIPVVAVNNASGEALKAVAEAGGSATIRTVLEEGWFEQAIPVVTIPGAEEPDKFVLLHGHYDSWDVGVGDNATGDATMLELARVFWRHRAKLRRGVRIAWWPGHSTGRYAGSTWFADAFAIDLDENCVAQVNCDSPGCRWATSYHQTTTMSDTASHVRDAIVQVTGTDTFATKRPNQAGDYSFNNIGLSSYFMLSSTMPLALRQQKNYYDVSGCGGNIAWHTENDTLEIADRTVLLADMRIYTLAVLRHANAAVLPSDWRATAREFADTIGRYQSAAGDLADLSPAREETAALAAALDRFHARIADGAVPAGRANEVIMQLARILVPINFTRQPRFLHDPAYTVPPLPALAVAEDLAALPADRRGFALTQLARGLNRVVAALRAARRLVDGAT